MWIIPKNLDCSVFAPEHLTGLSTYGMVSEPQGV